MLYHFAVAYNCACRVGELVIERKTAGYEYIYVFIDSAFHNYKNSHGLHNILLELFEDKECFFKKNTHTIISRPSLKKTSLK